MLMHSKNHHNIAKELFSINFKIKKRKGMSHSCLEDLSYVHPFSREAVSISTLDAVLLREVFRNNMPSFS